LTFTALFTGFSRTSPDTVLNGREIRWHFENLEPTEKNNLEISLVWPDLWQDLLTKQQAVQQNPNDGEAWGRLGKAAKELLFFHHDMRTDDGGQELYRISVAAYEKAVTLLPDDGLWYAGFAELLINHYYYAYPDQDTTEMQRGLAALNRSLELAPNNEKVQEIIGWLETLLPNEVLLGPHGYYFLTPTPQPTLTATSTATSSSTFTPTSRLTATSILSTTPASTRAVASISTVVPTVTQEGASSSAPSGLTICGVGLALPLMMVFGVVWSRGRRTAKRP
jgi:tetratricopeptide (TPR) repeat protein